MFRIQFVEEHLPLLIQDLECSFVHPHRENLLRQIALYTEALA